AWDASSFHLDSILSGSAAQPYLAPRHASPCWLPHRWALGSVRRVGNPTRVQAVNRGGSCRECLLCRRYRPVRYGGPTGIFVRHGEGLSGGPVHAKARMRPGLRIPFGSRACLITLIRWSSGAV